MRASKPGLSGIIRVILILLRQRGQAGIERLRSVAFLSPVINMPRGTKHQTSVLSLLREPTAQQRFSCDGPQSSRLNRTGRPHG